MFAAFGPVSFQVVASPTKFETSKKYRWEFIYVIGAPPVPQWIHDHERHIELSVMLHQIWCDPQTSLDALTQLAELHTQQSLVFGNGQNLGDYVIVQLRERRMWQADDGTILATELDIELAEYPSSTTAVVNYPQDVSIGNPPGLATSAASAPGASVVTAPATASPSGIAPAANYTDVPMTTIARQG